MDKIEKQIARRDFGFATGFYDEKCRAYFEVFENSILRMRISLQVILNHPHLQ